VALVTGGASGIGRALSEELARRGASIVLADVQAEEAAAVATSLAASGRSVGQPDAYPSVHKITWGALAKCGARTRSGRPCRGLVVTGTTPLSNARRRTWLRRLVR
jgi:NAD(P)-dependent dehydrogenase (short-subunit alcohol dehydrogenase family)